MSDADYLTNQLLIAMPMMGDPNFAQTVALICDHSQHGALGLILNKPLPMRMSEIFEQLEIELPGGPLSERQVLRGGPMQTDRGFVVHRAFGQWDSTLKVSDTLHVTTSRDILAAMARGEGPAEAVVALGYAGWDGGQLEDEIRANAWLSAPVDSRSHLRHAVRIALARGRAPFGHRALAHQSDQRQCLRGRRPPRPHAPQIVLAFDFGQRRIGVACGDTVSRTASLRPRDPRGPEGPRWDAIDALMREWRPGVLVVGLPYNVDDSESAGAARARRFAGELNARYRLPVELVDERYSSIEALDRLKGARASGLRKRRVAKSDVDAAAARIILERWFSKRA